MPPIKDDGKNRHIKDFFKPFTIPKHRIPLNDVVEEEIAVLAPAREQSSNPVPRTEEPAHPPSRRHTLYDDPPPSQTSPLSSALTILSSGPMGDTPKPLQAIQTAMPMASGTTAEGTISPSPPTSQRRFMAAVEVPSPIPARSDTVFAKPINTTKASFSSISSLTSIPLSTQSSSRRIVKNGMPAVTNSDSGSAESSSSSSSSDDELAPASTFVPRKRPKLDVSTNHSINTPQTGKPSMRQSVRLSESSDRSRRAGTPRRDITPPKTVYKHSLLNMAKQREKEEKAEARMRQMEAEFEENERRQDEERTVGQQRDQTKQAVLADDSDEAERMALAMLRTETICDNEDWFFFRGLRDNLEFAALPPEAVEKDADKWIERWQDENWRTQASLTGFLAELASEQGLSQHVRDWLAHQLLHEQREELRDAYIGILEAAKPPESITALLSLGEFYLLHDPGEEASQPAPDSPGSVPGQPRGLAQVISVVRHFTAQAGDHAIASLTLELMYAAIDATTRTDTLLQTLIAESMEYLLDSVHEEKRVLALASEAFASSKLSTLLKSRAILSLPGCSDPCHALRRHLALELICGRQISAALDSTSRVDSILSRLKNAPDFDISDSTDYIQLHALISVLDIAIDAGFPDHGVRSSDSMQAPPTETKADAAGKRTSASDGEAENVFNKQIDSFIVRLTLMSNRIKGAGAAHLHRAEAKQAIDRLAKRLEFGVRTKPRPQKKTFGGVTGDLQRTFLQGFLNEPSLKNRSSNGHMMDARKPNDGEMDVVEDAVEDVGNDID